MAKWLHAFWMKANDNNVRVPPRPAWCPKKYIYGKGYWSR